MHAVSIRRRYVLNDDPRCQKCAGIDIIVNSLKEKKKISYFTNQLFSHKFYPFFLNFIGNGKVMQNRCSVAKA